MTSTTTATMRPYGPLDPLEHLDASLEDFEPSIAGANNSPRHPPHRHPQTFGYPSTHSAGFRSDDLASEDLVSEEEEEDRDSVSEEASAGGYSPPAWRRLGNGDRSSGFWRRNDNERGYEYNSRESSPEYESADEGDEKVLSRAILTKLPRGSVSPDKERSPEPEFFPAEQHLGGIDEVVNGVKVEGAGDEKMGLRGGESNLWPGGNDVSENCKFALFSSVCIRNGVALLRFMLGCASPFCSLASPDVYWHGPRNQPHPTRYYNPSIPSIHPKQE